MNKNIKTHEADINLVEKFLDYANCADASYAMLHYINDTIKQDKKVGRKRRGINKHKDINSIIKTQPTQEPYKLDSNKIKSSINPFVSLIQTLA